MYIHLDCRFVITEILNNHNFINYEIEISKNKGSKCNYKKEKTKIYINESNNKGDANSIVVAAHEASHALNYYEGVTNPKLFKLLERVWWLFVGIAVIGILTDFLMFMFQGVVIPKTLLYLSIALYCISTITYILYYMRDESKTEKRALKELQTLYQDHQISSVPFLDVQKESKDRLKIWVYRKSILLLIFFLILPFGFMIYLDTVRNMI